MAPILSVVHSIMVCQVMFAVIYKDHINEFAYSKTKPGEHLLIEICWNIFMYV